MLRALIYIVSIHLSLYVDTISNEWCSVYRNLSHSLRFVFPFAVFLILCVSPDSMIWLCSLDSAHMHTTPKKQRDEYAQHKKKRKMVEQMRNSEYRYSTATERVMWFYWTVCVCELSYVIVGISAKAKKHRTPMHEILYMMTTERSCCRNLYVSFLFACATYRNTIKICHNA